MPRLLRTLWLQKKVERFVLGRADLITAINENNLQYARANGRGTKTAILPISANIEPLHRAEPASRPDAMPLLRRLGIERGRPAILYFGRLIDLKHPDDAVKAMATVLPNHPGRVGIIAGSGEMEPRLKRSRSPSGLRTRSAFPARLISGS